MDGGNINYEKLKIKYYKIINLIDDKIIFDKWKNNVNKAKIVRR